MLVYTRVMDLIIFPGNSISNRAWAEEVARHVKEMFETIRIVYYKHWETGEKTIDFDVEDKELIKITQGLGEYVIFAKSAGTILSLRGITEGVLKPVKNVFCGFPLKFGRSLNQNVDEWLPKLTIPTTVIQNTDDPAMSYKEMSEYMESVNEKVKTVETGGNTHDYEDYEVIKMELSTAVA